MRQALAVTVLLGVFLGLGWVFLGRTWLFATPDPVQIAAGAPSAGDGSRQITSSRASASTARATETLDIMRFVSQAAGRIDFDNDYAGNNGFSFVPAAPAAGSPLPALVPFRARISGASDDGDGLTAALAPFSNAAAAGAPRAGPATRALKSTPAEPAAVERYATAASGGDISAEYHLGLAYRDGIGVPADPAAALHWLVEAAKGAHSQAQIAVAQMYDGGKAVTRDPAAAYMWFDRAASGSAAAFVRDFAAKERDRVASTMTEAQLAAARAVQNQ